MIFLWSEMIRKTGLESMQRLDCRVPCGRTLKGINSQRTRQE